MKSMRKNTWLPLIGLRTFLFVTTAFTIVSCSDDKEEDGYNPNLPVRISELSPQEGGYFDKVILQGENFGNNPKRYVYSLIKRSDCCRSIRRSGTGSCPEAPG